ncbi:hypothetical protein IE81DRAFT_331637 [Ceraceosorus guamensis]|uniref:Uncharacterized protein n=1 Tax=Ceraceosorus guamensis TaxID=1522189 RepID=A0A316VS37_9BASI|nr:hypothetical protein IE81DRAFT_331637 [Ceraceosorus guamensis]PWN40459.1 hypothetical protein IE81DRAFT_331637 [Ceraceosorus guamensis]
MPKIIRAEDRANIRRRNVFDPGNFFHQMKRAGSMTKPLERNMTFEQAVNHCAYEMLKVNDSSSSVLTPFSTQIRLANTKLKFESFVNNKFCDILEIDKKLQASASTRMFASLAHSRGVPEDPLDYEDVPLLIERILVYLTFRTNMTRGHGPDEPDNPSLAHITSKTLVVWRNNLQLVVLQHIQQKQTVDDVSKTLTRVFQHLADSQSGLIWKLNNHVAWLRTNFQLVSHKKAITARYGLNEADLLLGEFVSRMYKAAGTVEQNIQLMAATAICTLSGLRICSLCAGNHPERGCYLQTSHFFFEAYRPGKYAMTVRITQLKGYHLRDKSKILPWFEPMQLPRNVHLPWRCRALKQQA